MKLDSFDLVASLQALPETDPIEIDGIQLSGGGGGSAQTCSKVCSNASVQIDVSVCIGTTC